MFEIAGRPIDFSGSTTGFALPHLEYGQKRSSPSYSGAPCVRRHYIRTPHLGCQYAHGLLVRKCDYVENCLGTDLCRPLLDELVFLVAVLLTPHSHYWIQGFLCWESAYQTFLIKNLIVHVGA